MNPARIARVAAERRHRQIDCNGNDAPAENVPPMMLKGDGVSGAVWWCRRGWALSKATAALDYFNSHLTTMDHVTDDQLEVLADAQVANASVQVPCVVPVSSAVV
jgi:hypothetical protein